MSIPRNLSFLAENASSTGVLEIVGGGTGATTRQNAMDALAGAVTSGSYLRGNGTDVVMATIQAADVPTLNQNTTGNATTATTATNLSGGSVAATTITGTSFTSASTFGFKNRIINGAMLVDQRGTAGTPISSNAAVNPYTLDRWRSVAIAGSGQFNIQQSTVSPAGFVNSLLATSLAATTVVSTDAFAIRQPIEGFNCADLGFGTASASAVTLSFWVRSSLTGTFGGALQNQNANRSYPFSYTITTANTWEQKTLTIAGDTSGTWNTNSNGGINLWLGLGVGSTKSGTAGSWAAADYVSVTGAVQVVATNTATFYITGVQLEKGSTATTFDYRPYGTELALCQRYYYLLSTASARELFNGQAYNTTSVFGKVLDLPVSMRTAPTITLIGSLSPSNSAGTLQASFSGITIAGASSTMIATGSLTGSSGLVAGNSSVVYLSAGGGLSISAEL